MSLKDLRSLESAWATTIRRDPCSYCDQTGAGGTVDHIHPPSRGGGQLDPLNITGACRICNGRKGDKTLLLALLTFDTERRITAGLTSRPDKPVPSQFPRRVRTRTTRSRKALV